MRKIISIDIIDLKTGKSRGCGTAFWAEISSGCKLVTAKHIAWPQEPAVPSFPVIDGEELLVIWATTSGDSGYGKATCNTSPQDQTLDYATLHFLDSEDGPPQEPFKVSNKVPTKGALVTTAGFPGKFLIALPPNPNFTSGVVELAASDREGILVGGRAVGGYSGGPAFYVDVADEASVGDEVIGLMSGQPKAEAMARAGLADAYVLLAAHTFC